MNEAPLPAETGSSFSSLPADLSRFSQRIRRDLGLLLRAQVDPRTPWHVRLLFGLVLAYAISPIDLIPDVIPILGQIDDLLLISLGLAICIRLLPPELREG